MQTKSLLALLSLLASGACTIEEAVDPTIEQRRMPPAGSRLYGVFEGKVPCADCERTKIALTLHQEADALSPTTYLLERIYVGLGDDRYVSEGIWTQEGVVRLDEASPEELRTYMAVGDNILLILDADMNPRVGNASHSFTLSRTH